MWKTKIGQKDITTKEHVSQKNLVNTYLFFISYSLNFVDLCKISLPNLICMSLVTSAFYGASKFSFRSKFLLGVLVRTIFPPASNSTPKLLIVPILLKIFPHPSSINWGLCIKNEAGFFIIARTTWLNQPLSIFEGEAMDHLLAIWWLQELVVSHVIMTWIARLLLTSSGFPLQIIMS